MFWSKNLLEALALIRRAATLGELREAEAFVGRDALYANPTVIYLLKRRRQKFLDAALLQHLPSKVLAHNKQRLPPNAKKWRRRTG